MKENFFFKTVTYIILKECETLKEKTQICLASFILTILNVFELSLRHRLKRSIQSLEGWFDTK